MPSKELGGPISGSPLQVGNFTLHETGITVSGRPEFKDWEAVGEFLRGVYKAAPFWWGDWLKYGEGREDWAERMSQALEASGYEYDTLKNLKYVCENVAPSRRRIDVPFTHHAEVASLSPKEQTEWLEKTVDKGLSVRDLRMEIRASKRRGIIEGQAEIKGMFRVVYADPPWTYGDAGVVKGTAYGKAARHYPTMTIEELCKMPVASHVQEDAVLFLWVTAPLLLQTPGPREVISAWGFEPKTGMVWNKVLGNFGHYVHICHEHLIIATRGSCLPDQPTPQPKSVETIRRSGEHSEKPDEFRKMIDKLYTKGSKLELFGRKVVKGWTVYGNQWLADPVGESKS